MGLFQNHQIIYPMRIVAQIYLSCVIATQSLTGHVSYTSLLHQVYGLVVLFQMFYNITDVLVALGLLLLGSMNALIPWIYNYTFLLVVMFMIGISFGIINTGNLHRDQVFIPYRSKNIEQ